MTNQEMYDKEMHRKYLGEAIEMICRVDELAISWGATPDDEWGKIRQFVAEDHIGDFSLAYIALAVLVQKWFTHSNAISEDQRDWAEKIPGSVRIEYLGCSSYLSMDRLRKMCEIAMAEPFWEILVREGYKANQTILH